MSSTIDQTESGVADSGAAATADATSSGIEWPITPVAVSYTHLTLPTIYSV